MKWRWIPLLAFAFAWSCLGNPCSPAFTPPADDACTGEDTSGTADSIQIGPLGASDGDPFVAYHDGDQAVIVHGGQGATMLPVRLHVAGAGAPGCLAQHTEVFSLDPQGPPESIGQDDTALRTYADGDGRTTHAAYIILGFGASGTVQVTATGAGRSAAIELGLVGPVDLGAPPDAAQPLDLATPPDLAAARDSAAPPDGGAPIDAADDGG